MSPAPAAWACRAAEERIRAFVRAERRRANRAMEAAAIAANTRAIAEAILERIPPDPLGAQHRAELEAAITQPRRTA